MTFKAITYFSLLTVLFIISIVRFKKLSNPFKYLAVLISYTLISEITGRYLIKTINTSFPVYHFLSITGLILNMFIYIKIQVVDKAMIILIIGLTFLLSGLACYNSIFIQSLYEFPSNSIMLHGFQTIILALMLYLNMLNYPVQTSIYKQAAFWFNTGNFVFYGITFTLFALYNFYYKTGNINSKANLMIYCANIFLYSAYLYALILDSKTKDE